MPDRMIRLWLIFIFVCCVLGPLKAQIPMPTITANTKMNSTPPAIDQAHKLAAAAACNDALVGQGVRLENPAPNTYCQHGGTNSVANGAAIWGYNTPPSTGALSQCLKDVVGSGNGVPTNGCVIVLDAQPVAYDTPQGSVPDHNYLGQNSCIRMWTIGNVVCHGWMPPTYQANPNAPQFIYFISTQYAALPSVGTRINPSDVLPGDGYSHPLNLQPNINPKTQMGLIRSTQDTVSGGVLFFGDGPMNYQFEGFEIVSQSTVSGRPNAPPFSRINDPPEIYGYIASPLIYMTGEGLTGGRALYLSNVISGTSYKTYQNGVVHTVNTGYPAILQCHMDGANGPDMMANYITPNVPHTIFCDTYYTHLAQGQTMITWSWNARLNGDFDVSMPALTAGGSKYSANSGQCANGATAGYTPAVSTSPSSSEPALGNVCVVDTSSQCDGVTPGQCFKVQFQIAQNATAATCQAAANGSTAAASAADNVPNCFNGGIHSFFIDTPPTTAPPNCFGPWPNPAADGSDCPQHWQGGGPWAAGTEHVMTTDGVRVGMDSTGKPPFTMTSDTVCTDTTLNQPCERSPIDNTIILRNSAPASGSGCASSSIPNTNGPCHTYAFTVNGYNSYWQQSNPANNNILTTAMTATSTTVVLQNPNTALGLNSVLQIDSEYMRVATANSSTNFTVQRADAFIIGVGSLAAPHAAGATVYIGPRLQTGLASALTITSPSSFTFSRTEQGASPGNVQGVQVSMWGGGGGIFGQDPKYQDPASEFDSIPRAAWTVLSGPLFYGVDFCSLPIGDGSLGSQYSRMTHNQTIKGRSFTIRCFLFIGTGSNFSTANLACTSTSTNPCPDSFKSIGLDFGADIAIDKVTIVNNSTLDIVAFVCDGVTQHLGCTPQLMADMGAFGGPWLEHLYVHGSGRVVHTTNGGDPGPQGADCAGDLVVNNAAAQTWQCTMSGGRTSQQGVRLEGHNASFRDSFLDNIWSNIDYGAPETQAIFMLIGTGSHEIRNNYIVGAGEFIFSGGGGADAFTSTQGNICDVTIDHNLEYRPHWWLNYGIGIYGKTGIATDRRQMENKNLREQKGGCRWEWANGIMDNNFYGFVQTYAATDWATRIQQNQANLCCQFTADEYLHDNLLINANQIYYLYGKDPYCGLGLRSVLCGRGVQIPWLYFRTYVFNELSLIRMGNNNTAPGANSGNNAPYLLKTGSMPRHITMNHLTLEFQPPAKDTLNHGFFADMFPNDQPSVSGVPTRCPNPPTNTQGPQARDNRNFWLQNTIFASGIADSGGCGPASYARWPATAGADLPTRWRGNIFANIGPYASSPNGLSSNNYVEGTTGPSPFMTYISTAPMTYIYDVAVGFPYDYTLTGNAQNNNISTQVLSSFIAPNATNTTDQLTSGIIMSRLAAAIATTATGNPYFIASTNGVRLGKNVKVGTGVKIH